MSTQPQSIYLPLQYNHVLEIVRQLGLNERRNLLLYLLGLLPDKEDLALTHLASERSLAKDWLTETEDEAWQNL